MDLGNNASTQISSKDRDYQITLFREYVKRFSHDKKFPNHTAYLQQRRQNEMDVFILSTQKRPAIVIAVAHIGVTGIK